MKLRPELMPPTLDEASVARLAVLAAEIDGGDPLQTREQLATFNREAMTAYEFIDFQGIYGAQEHITWVRRVLAVPHQRHVADVTRSELIEMARRVMDSDGPEHDIGFWLDMLAINIPDERISDLIFWPDDYFGHETDGQALTPEQLIDVALAGRAIAP
ncbi:hypothetical protein ASF84_18790 [Pseudomonas sp. Leaf127]|uniref:hypothetical protein n=1 Tax=Pseudomonas TaxID=286 RepID=UPI00070339A7|nr:MULTISPECIES: hypothetical protein [Pseudomonas]KQQ53852.1 hypothetical protein ASF84_18790 [Pseudomonas sp. Leaf127]